MLILKSKEDCCGCTACNSICSKNAIIQVEDEQGFIYPKIDEDKCINCGMCIKVCPMKEENNKRNDKPIAFAMKHKDDIIRLNSSSGGAFTAISDLVINNKGVVYGATFNDEFKVVHSKANSYEKRDLFRGSKYVQSNLNKVFNNIKNDLDNGEKVLFTGTACQVAGLKNFLRNHKQLNNLTTVDIICHGVPSPLIFEDYKKYIIKRHKSSIESMTFRSKKDLPETQNIEIVFKNGKVYFEKFYYMLYGYLFGKNYILRPSCYKCPFANTNRVSDITIGDFWGIKKNYLNFDDEKGISLMLANSEKGISVINLISKNQNVSIIECELKKSLQPNLISPSKKPDDYNKFWSYYIENGFIKSAKKYGNFTIKTRLKVFIKNMLRYIKK